MKISSLLTLTTLCYASVTAQQLPDYAVTQAEMRPVYEAAQTPYKYGMVVAPSDNQHKIDCPTVFRQGDRWLMTYVIYNGQGGKDGRGYETWLAESDDLLHWQTQGRLLSYVGEDAHHDAQNVNPDPWHDTLRWDCNQRGGFPSLLDWTWGGSYALQSFEGRHWMSYLGGAGTGYEGVNGPLHVGMAWTDGDVARAHEWHTYPYPILSEQDATVQWWDSLIQYKSMVYLDAEQHLGAPFVMYYNAGGINPATGYKGERIGIATSHDMRRWTRYEGNPVFSHESQGIITGDAQIQRMTLRDGKVVDGAPSQPGDVVLYTMFYFSAFSPNRPYYAFNTFACSKDLVHWYDWEGDDLIIPTAGTYDEMFAHKSFVLRHEGTVYHFYCAVNDAQQRGIAVATSRDMGQSAVTFPAPPPTKAKKNPLGKAQWIAMEPLDTLVTPLIHAPFVKKALQGRHLGDYVLPVFRREVEVGPSAVRRATLDVCGLGHFEASIDGRKVGDHLLDPGWTQYDKEALYVSFDVTRQLREQGRHTLSVAMGNGFYNVPRGRYNKLMGTYGQPKLCLRLHIEYSNGRAQDVVTDADWQCAASTITYSSIYGGEDVDQRIQPQWQPVMVLPAEGQPMLRQQQGTELVVIDSLQAVSCRQDAQGRWVYDFGQNMSGIVEAVVKGHHGQTVAFRPGELLDDEGAVSQRATGRWLYQVTLGADDKGDTLRRYTQTLSPKFSYYGFRYVELEGCVPAGQPNPEGLPVVERLTALHTSSQTSRHAVSTFWCSDSTYNQIHRVIDWAIRSNLASVITDCPHREKMGWLEQDHLMLPSMLYRYDMLPLYRKLMNDMEAAQFQAGQTLGHGAASTPWINEMQSPETGFSLEGMIPTIAPYFTNFGYNFDDTPEWGSAFIIAPWYLYQWTGNDELFRQHYPAMQRYIDYLSRRAKGHIIDYGLGDWYDLGPENPGYSQLTTQGVTATATYYYDVTLMAAMARVLGRMADAAAYDQQAMLIRNAYNARFLHTETTSDGTRRAWYDRGSQTANAISLYFGLVPEAWRQEVLQGIVTDIEQRVADPKTQYVVTAGDVGFRYLIKALEQGNRHDIIALMNSRADVPGYRMQLAKGVTTLAESWMALTNVSHNHLMLGHLMEWLYGSLAGIRQAEGSTGWQDIVIDPHPVPGIDECRATLQTPRGPVSVHWKVIDGRLQILEQTVPEAMNNEQLTVNN